MPKFDLKISPKLLLQFTRICAVTSICGGAVAFALHSLTGIVWLTYISASLLILGGASALLTPYAMTRPLKDFILTIYDVIEYELPRDRRERNAIDRLVGVFSDILSSFTKSLKEVSDSSTFVEETSRELQSSSELGLKIIGEIADDAKSISEGTVKQHESIIEVSKVLLEISSIVHRMAAKAQANLDASNRTLETVGEGEESIKYAIDKMLSIREVVESSAEVISQLGRSSQEIGEITETIMSISDQTNLLALNAAIEAARAGELGRGFGVVAEEIRKLAEQSAEAADRISSLIKDIQEKTGEAMRTVKLGTSEVHESSAIVDRAGEALKNIVENITNMIGDIQDSFSLAQENVASPDEVIKVIDRIATIAEENANLAEKIFSATNGQAAAMIEIANSASVLHNTAEELKNLVRTLYYNEMVFSRSTKHVLGIMVKEEKRPPTPPRKSR
ncbi:MAG: methyl-accepting chemotaxis protein [bacterium]